MFNGVLQDDAEKSVGAFFKMLANSDGCVWQCLSLEKKCIKPLFGGGPLLFSFCGGGPLHCSCLTWSGSVAVLSWWWF